MASINESNQEPSSKIAVEKDDDQDDVRLKSVELINKILEKTELDITVDSRRETAENVNTDQHIIPLENCTPLESDRLDQNPARNDNTQSKLSVHPLDMLRENEFESDLRNNQMRM